MPLHSKEHIKLLKALVRNEVKFLLIGGHAAIYYGVHRNTGDLDILVEPTRHNGNKLVKALLEIGLEVPEILPEEFEKELVLGFGFEPDAVDILNYTPGIDFEVTYQNSILINFEGISVRVIDIRDLIRNKEALNRTGEKSLMDKYDAEVLKKILKKKKD